MDNWGDHAWLIWIGVAVVFGLIEITSLDFFFLMLAGGALAASAADAVGAPLAVQVIAFAAASGVLLFVARPPLRAWTQKGDRTITGTAALVGHQARVVEPVTETSGLVKLSGEVWSARVEPGALTLEVDSPVHVIKIDGATAVVAPTTQLPEIPEGRQ
ncbi:NfeD family protein [Kineosporia succinea]|uniref:Membrane protein implicated in regulation of membrane protease activity n=1 Tax=Kineosporia succinea TaxID=84632 RepID=A0ABT9P7D5_9ACTN|nr:NfeD family protein [Kineosporia succinea]MDP9828603.1 membrane protein implicated in regulation of membrane protease activity [Kineosporia succinea]